MSCTENQQRILERDWDEPSLREAAELRNHVEQCDNCRHALADHDALRGLLCDSGDQATPAGGWQQFEQALCNDIGRHVTIAEPSARGHQGAWFLALAATAVVAATGWWMYLNAPPGNNPGVAQQPAPRDDWSDESLRLTTADIDHGMNLYRNVSEVVDGRAGWVAVAAETTELGVSASPVAVQGNLVLLRLSMARDGKVASNTDLVMRPGQTVELSVPLENQQTLRYKIKTNGTTARRVSVWAEVHDAARQDQTVAALATNLTPTPGQVIRAGTMQTSEGGYELAMAFAEQEITGNTP